MPRVITVTFQIAKTAFSSEKPEKSAKMTF
jgi:hypothetical protein